MSTVRFAVALLGGFLLASVVLALYGPLSAERFVSPPSVYPGASTADSGPTRP